MRFLLDEMFPPAACQRLAESGHDAQHVRERGLVSRPDTEIEEVARSEGRVLATENIRDFAAAPDLVIICVLKSRLPADGMAVHLADLLDEWAIANPTPYVGMHWPKIGT